MNRRFALYSIILISLMSWDCSKKHRSNEPIGALDSLKVQKALYISLSKPEQITRCDKLTFLSLSDAFGYQDEELFRFEYAPGEWHRDLSRCYPKDSKSEISWDSLLMLSQALWTRQDNGAMYRLMDYGKNNDWVMGEGDRDLTFIPQLYVVLNKMLNRSELEQHLDYPRTEDDQDQLGILTGFQAHLQVEYIWLNARIYGSISDTDLYVLKGQSEREPENALFQALYHRYTDGVQDEAIAILNKVNYFPKDRLPTTLDRCEPFLWQRDYNEIDWLPCEGSNQTHPGIDFIVAMSAIEGK